MSSRGNDLVSMYGQPSWHLVNDAVELWITRAGGHTGPIRFQAGGRSFEPMSVAPWALEHHPDQPQMLRSLRGDFFCMPFGGGSELYNGEAHPPHGQTANCDWNFDEIVSRGEETAISLSIQTTQRPGKVRKIIAMRTGQPVVYSRHIISDASGPMTLGHHAMLRFATPGLVATSAFVFGQVIPAAFEDPAQGGYQALKEGAIFDRLDQVPMKNGETADLTVYPARAGFEDMTQIFADPSLDFAWTAVTFPQEHYLWFALKDPRVLTSTAFWFSNGGRHYAPWNSRHRAVLGMEEITSYFGKGIAVSAGENPASSRGLITHVELDPQRPVVVNYLFGVTTIPDGFGRVDRIVRTADGIVIHSGSQSVEAAINWDWFDTPAISG